MEIATVLNPETLTARFDNLDGYVAADWDLVKPEYRDLFGILGRNKSPFVLHISYCYIKRVLPSMLARFEDKVVLMYGGFSNRSEWLYYEPSELMWDIEEIDGVPTVVGFVPNSGLYFPAWQNPDLKSTSIRGVFDRLNRVKDSADLKPAGKLSDLDVGSYLINDFKTINTKYGEKAILVIDNNEYWANKYINNRVAMGINPKGKTLQVLAKYTSSNGHACVDAMLTD